MKQESRKKSRELALANYQHVCDICKDADADQLQCHHIDSDPDNDHISNLILLCANCHEKINKNVWYIDSETRIAYQTDTTAGLVELVGDTIMPPAPVMEALEEFHRQVPSFEQEQDRAYLLSYDGKARCYYTECHIRGNDVNGLVDLDAAIDPDEEDYRINREPISNGPAFIAMLQDASAGRQFSDIVVEWNAEYQPDLPLKILGGQHRCMAINGAESTQPNRYHQFRVYFNLNKEQRVEIATISNTAITVSPDLLDRMQESVLGTQLRDWCQEVGLLEKEKDFSDRRRNDGSLSVRSARTIFVNYVLGKDYPGDLIDVHVPYYCKPGPALDPKYIEARNNYPDLWNDSSFKTMGRMLAKLHRKQFEACQSDPELKSSAEFRNKVFTPAVLSAWAYTSGLLQKETTRLEAHYELYQDDLKKVSKDPLNVLQMTKTKSKNDSPNYRGLGTRSDPDERGRLTEVFLAHSDAKMCGRGLSKDLINSAVEEFVGKKGKREAALSREKAMASVAKGVGRKPT